MTITVIRSQASHGHDGQISEPPSLFVCPISLSLMVDPVILTTGQTFDRCSIEKWMGCGHMTCPISRLPLQPNEEDLLIPNHALTRIIHQWCLRNNLPIPATPTPPPPTLNQIRHLLSLSDQYSAFKKIVTMARNRPRTQQLMVQAGALHVLASLLAKPTSIALDALSFMSLLCRHRHHVRDLQWEPTMEHISCLCLFLATGTLKSKVHAVLILHTLDTTKVVMALKESSMEGLAMAGLMDILSSQMKQHQGRASSVYALRLLNALVRCSSVENQLVSACIERGGVVVVVDTLVATLEALRMTSSSSDKLVWIIEAGMLALEALVCESVEGRSSFLDHGFCIDTVVRIMGRVSEAVTEHCVEIMLSLLTWKTVFANQDSVVAHHKRRAKRAMVEAGGVIKLVLLASFSSKGKRKALQLLKLLQENVDWKKGTYNSRLS